MPKALAFKKNQLKRLRDDGYVETPFGRRRRFPLLVRNNFEDARKSCVHMPIASTASDLTLLATIELAEAGVPIVLTVHDSILAEVPQSLANKVAKQMSQTMIKTAEKYLPDIPWVADADVRERWASPP